MIKTRLFAKPFGIAFLFLIPFQMAIGEAIELGNPLPFHAPVSGTLGEVRGKNLHTGTDFKTYGINGHSLLAVFDGSIEQINRSEKGYGLSIHIRKKTGEVYAKYAHMESFHATGLNLDRYLIFLAFDLLSLGEDYSITFLPNEFPVSKGEVVGRTGESGTGVPHLHLEIKNANTTFNPLVHSTMINQDDFHPVLVGIYLEDATGERFFPLEKKNKTTYKIANGNEIQIHNFARLKLGAYDRIRSQNKNSIYSYQLFVDRKEIFENNFSKLVYPIKATGIYDLEKSTYNPPVYYYNLYANGSNSVEALDTKTKHVFVMAASDAKGNQSKLEFTVEWIQTESTSVVEMATRSLDGKNTSQKNKTPPEKIPDLEPPVISNYIQFRRNGDIEYSHNAFKKTYWFSITDNSKEIQEPVTIFLEGKKYPGTYDKDRRAVAIEIPKRFFETKPILLLELQARDRAGNWSKVFTELLTLD